MIPTRSHYGQLLLSIFVMSSSGMLGRFIDMPVPMIIWSRCLIAGLALIIYLKVRKESIGVHSLSDLLLIVVASTLFGIHWITYFLALKYAGVAIGMLSLFTYPVMAAILDPLITRSTPDWKSIFLALIGFLGVFFLIPDVSLGNQVTLGVLMGLISALVFVFRIILSKRIVKVYSGVTAMMHQAVALVFLLLPFFWVYDVDEVFDLNQINWIALIVLSLYTTAIAHTLWVKSLAHFNITTISIVSCLTPLFGIFHGMIFLNEQPTYQVWIGGAVILTSVILESLRMIKKSTL